MSKAKNRRITENVEAIQNCSMRLTATFDYINSKQELKRYTAEIYEYNENLFWAHDIGAGQIKSFKYENVYNLTVGDAFVPRQEYSKGK